MVVNILCIILQKLVFLYNNPLCYSVKRNSFIQGKTLAFILLVMTITIVINRV